MANGSRPTTTPFPWLSALLLGACLAFSVHARLRDEQVAREGNAALGAARDYYLAHAYLEPGVALKTHFDAAALLRARAEHEQRAAAQGSVPTPPGVIRRQQGELDKLVETALAHVGTLPAQQVAFAPGRSGAHTWLAYLLLHGGNAVLIGNGLLLLFFGLYLERSFGRAAYAALVAWLVAAGAAGWTIAVPRDAVYGLVGTTPLLAGLAAAFAARFASRYNEGFYFAGLLASALWLLLPPYATANWSFAALEFAATAPPPAATSVYLPCLAAVIAAALASALAWGIGLDGSDERDASGDVRDPRLRRALRARAAKRPREALELLTEYLADQPDAYEAALAAHEVARELGRDADVTAAALRVIRIELRRGLSAAALDHWLDLVRGGIPESTDAPLLIHMALLLREFDQQAEAVRALRFALENSDDRENHVIAMRIARAARGLDPGTSETAAWRALGSVDLSLKDRQALESLIAEGLTTPAARAASYERIEDRNAPRFAASAPSPAPATAPAQPEPESVPAHPARPAAIEIETRDVRVLDAVLAVPLELGADGVEIQTSQGQKKLVRYERIEALSVAAVSGVAAKPVIFVDLVLNWMTPRNETLRVIRLRSDQFDPRSLIAEQASPIDALRAFVKKLLDRSSALALPDAEAALGRPFAAFDELAIYQRAVLLVEGPAQPSSR